jgi:probable rRNA maturation factor
VKGERLAFRSLADVSLIGDLEMRELNRSRRGADKTTDVLSFPMLADVRQNAVGQGPPRRRPSSVPDPDTGRVFLGDVLISGNMAQKQALDYGHSLDRELAYLTVHGILHLLGYRHGTEPEKVLMREREEYIMERMGLFR